jgi:hypothetical protein
MNHARLRQSQLGRQPIINESLNNLVIDNTSTTTSTTNTNYQQHQSNNPALGLKNNQHAHMMTNKASNESLNQSDLSISQLQQHHHQQQPGAAAAASLAGHHHMNKVNITFNNQNTESKASFTSNFTNESNLAGKKSNSKMVCTNQRSFQSNIALYKFINFTIYILPLSYRILWAVSNNNNNR